MQFGSPASKPDEKPARMTWNGTGERARQIADWGRDDALLPLVQATPPDRNAPEGSPEASWTLKALVPVSGAQGGGVQWDVVPVGAVVRNTGTWVDPVLEIVTARRSAATFEES